MRRKLRILFLIGVTVLAGTQEAARQFDNLKSSMTELTRAGLWSGLIVYAQPVTDGKLPSPQIYYLIPEPQSVPDAPAAAEFAMLVDSCDANTATPKPAAKNNHTAADAPLSTDVTTTVAATREVEDPAKSGLVVDKLPLNLIASDVGSSLSKLEVKRVYEEVAKHESFARNFQQDAGGVIAKVFVKEFDAAQLEAELLRLAAAQEQLVTSKLKSSGEPEKDSPRQLEIKVMRRHPIHRERLKVFQPPFAEKRLIALPDMSSIGCEKAATAKAAPAAIAAPSVRADVKIAGESLVNESTLRALSITTSTSWALGCDSETEQK